MLRSTIGVHTMSIFLQRSRSEMETLVKHFCKYRERTKTIRMFIPQRSSSGKEAKYSEYSPRYSNGHLILPSVLKIIYPGKDCGISWKLRCEKNNAFKSYWVEAKINPKILGGTQDYISAAIYDDLLQAIPKFDLMVKNISPLLRTFACYKPNRIDYCANLALRELAPGCPSDMVMKLIQRADVPPDYEPKMEYSETSHRKGLVQNSLYLECESTNINCYEKLVELQKRNRKDEESGPITQEVLEEARDIIRFEVQCLYPRTRKLCQQAKIIGLQGIDIYKHLFDYKTFLKVINAYYKNTIGRGDWFTLSAAEEKIESKSYNSQKEDRLRNALREVNQCRSLSKAKAKYQGDDLEAFKRTLKDLADIGINPVTIPREWGIAHIPNLMRTFNDTSLSRELYPDPALI